MNARPSIRTTNQNGATPMSVTTLTHTLAQLDPAELLVDVNVREDLHLDPAFVGSVKERGVLVPVVAVQTSHGVRVRHGHRRTMAAVEAKLATIPVVVVSSDGDEVEQSETVDRLIDQYSENTHRAALSTREQASVMQQLSLLGLSPAQISRRTKTPKASVAAGIVAAESDAALAAADSYGLDLVQTAVVAEFADDPEDVEALLDAATYGQFDHTAQRIRDNRAASAAVDAKIEELRAAGVTVVERENAYGPDARQRPLHQLQSGHDSDKEMTEDEHASCPGHAVYVQYRSYGDPPDTLVVPVCADVISHGHTVRYGAQPTTTGAEPTPEEVERVRAERRRVIENNKQWRSAETVRREWLVTFAGRKSAPKRAAAFLLHMLVTEADDLSRARQGGHRLAAAILGLDVDDADEPSYTAWYRRLQVIQDALAAATPQRAQVIGLTVALAACEDQLSTQTWRHPGTRDQVYIQFLADAGYTLSPVEQLVLDHQDETDQTEQQ